MALPLKIRWASIEKSFTDCAFVAGVNPAEQQLGMSKGSSEPELNSYWFTSDHLGSSAFVTDGSGVAIQHLEYMAFGEVFVVQRRTGFGTPYKFNAKELDCESGYYYYSARYYDPRMARFLSVDPLAGEMPEWGSYTYTFNNPLKYIDPTGMRAEEPDDWVYGALRGIYWDEKATSQATTKEGEVYLGADFATVSDNGLQTNYNSDRSFDHNSTDDGNLPTITVTGYRDSKLEYGASAVNSGLGFKNEVLNSLKKGNQLTKSGANYLKFSKVGGGAAAGLSLVPSGMNMIDYYKNDGGNWQVGAKFALDAMMAGIGTVGGPPDVFISTAYFLTDYATDGFGGFGEPVKVTEKP